MEHIVEKLTVWKKKIENAKKEEAEATGRLSEMYKQLKTEFKVSTLEEGEELVTKLQAELETVGSKILKLFSDVQKEADEIERNFS